MPITMTNQELQQRYGPGAPQFSGSGPYETVYVGRNGSIPIRQAKPLAQRSIPSTPSSPPQPPPQQNPGTCQPPHDHGSGGGSSGGSTGQTTSTSRFDNGVIDISIIPYMRKIDLQFVAESMRPQRRVYYFFDGVDINNFVLKPDMVKLSTAVGFTGHFSNNDSVTVQANSAQVLVSQVDPDTNTTFLLLANTQGVIKVGQTLTGSRRGNTGVVTEYIHGHGRSYAGGTANTLTLANSSTQMANNYWGTDGSNTIYIVTGTALGQNATITGFNNVTKVLSITGTWTATPPANSRYSIGTHWTTRKGTVAGTFVVPSTNEHNFLTGQRIFRIIDISSGVTDDCSTRADYTFVAEGLHQTKNDVIINSVVSTEPPAPTPVSTPVPPNPQPTKAPKNPARPPIGGNSQSNGRGRDGDPLAQTFFVDGNQFPNGIFLSSVLLFFRTKDSYLPVSVQVRPVVNGFPHSYEVVKGSLTTVYPENVNISETPDVDDPTTATEFRFQSPIYLPPGEHALVVTSTSLNYDIFCAELGEKIFGSSRIVSEQPYIGSLFKSQNASTWTPTQLEDLMFVLRRCNFVPTGQVVFANQHPTNDIVADLIYTHADDAILPNTTVGYEQSNDSGANYTDCVTDTNYVPDSRLSIDGDADGTYMLRASLTTTDNAVSPILYTENYNFLAIENYINNANLSNLDITITSGGAGYDANANVLMTLIGGGATVGATVYALANATNVITSVIVTDGGSHYVNTASMVASGSNGNSSAVFTMTGEDSPSGGPAIARYVSRVATLESGFNAADLRVLLTAFKPQGTDVLVYYKVRNSLDPEKFEAKRWVLMKQNTPTYAFSSSFSDTIEYDYVPDTGLVEAITYTSQGTTYNSFNQYAIKIVLLSDNTVKFPIVYDMRAIALPAS